MRNTATAPRRKRSSPSWKNLGNDLGKRLSSSFLQREMPACLTRPCCPPPPPHPPSPLQNSKESGSSAHSIHSFIHSSKLEPGNQPGPFIHQDSPTHDRQIFSSLHFDVQ